MSGIQIHINTTLPVSSVTGKDERMCVLVGNHGEGERIMADGEQKEKYKYLKKIRCREIHEVAENNGGE